MAEDKLKKMKAKPKRKPRTPRKAAVRVVPKPVKKKTCGGCTHHSDNCICENAQCPWYNVRRNKGHGGCSQWEGK